MRLNTSLQKSLLNVWIGGDSITPEHFLDVWHSCTGRGQKFAVHRQLYTNDDCSAVLLPSSSISQILPDEISSKSSTVDAEFIKRVIFIKTIENFADIVCCLFSSIQRLVIYFTISNRKFSIISKKLILYILSESSRSFVKHWKFPKKSRIF
jgi:hypothetical protein